MKILLLSLVMPAFAAEELPRQAFQFRQGEEKFVATESGKLLVSANCLRPNGTLECEAVAHLKKLSWKKRGARRGVASVSLCEDQLGGSVVIGTNAAGENSFCRFPDGSLVDGGSLIYRARKND